MLDFKTLLFLAFVFLFFATIYGFWLEKKHPQAQGIRFFTLFAFSFLVGKSLHAMRNLIPDFFSIVFANTLIALGTLWLYVALRALFGLDARWHKRYFVPVILVFTGFVIFTYLFYDTNMRILILSLFFAFYLGLFAWMSWRYGAKPFARLHRFTSLFFALGAVLFIARSFAANTLYLPANYLSTKELYILLPYYYLDMACALLSVLFYLHAKRCHMPKS